MLALSKSHRVIGFLVALVIVLLSVTGIALNHSSSLRLGSTAMPQGMARLFYGVSLSQREYTVRSKVFSVESGHLMVDQNAVGVCWDLSGVLALEQFLVAVCEDSLVLLSPEFALVEQWYAEPGLSGGIRRVGLSNEGGNVLQIADKQGWRWQLNLDTMVLAQTDPSATSPEIVIVNLDPSSGAPELTIERLIQDLHSGRALGGWGVWLVDLTALGLLWLTISGYLSWRARQKLLDIDFGD